MGVFVLILVVYQPHVQESTCKTWSCLASVVVLEDLTSIGLDVCIVTIFCNWPAGLSFSTILFSFCLQSFPASGSLTLSWLFMSGCPSIGASASASLLPMNIQGWFPLGLTGFISLQSKGLSRVFSNTTTHQGSKSSGLKPSLRPNSHIHTWLLEKT